VVIILSNTGSHPGIGHRQLGVGWPATSASYQVLVAGWMPLRRSRQARPTLGRAAGRFKAPDQVYFETLPKTSTGKIQKKVLGDRVSDQA
jgi:acyl-CoA synthetase (AMP-forming)/AMP-acid ligase II